MVEFGNQEAILKGDKEEFKTREKDFEMKYQIQMKNSIFARKNQKKRLKHKLKRKLTLET
jgi:hypothetical protein